MVKKQLNYPELIKNNLGKQSISIALPGGVTAVKILPVDTESFSGILKLLIACFCRHPRRIIEQIQHAGERGLEEVVKDLFEQTLGIIKDDEEATTGMRVWRGTVGEVLATAYVIAFTPYVVPIFKLRFAPNRRVSMHGDDLLGFQVTVEGEPSSLLVGEAKNWQDNIGSAVKAANETLLKVKDSSPTLLNFVIEGLDAQGRYDEAKIIQRFLDEYDYDYEKKYLAFVVSDKQKWKDELCLLVSPKPATPLEIATFVMENWEVFLKSLTFPDDEDLPTFSLPTIKIDDLADVQKLLDNSLFRNHHSRLASAALATALQIEGRERIQYELEPRRIERAARFISTSAIRLSVDNKVESQNLLYFAARILERLAVWELERGDKDDAISAIVEGAVAYAIAGYGANARVLMETIGGLLNDVSDLLVPAEKFSVLFLCGRLSDLEDEVATILLRSQQVDSATARDEAHWNELIGLTLAYVADTLMAKSFALLLHYLRTGRSELVNGAIENIRYAASTYSLIGEYKSSHLSTTLAVYFQCLAVDSPHALLPEYVTGVGDG